MVTDQQIRRLYKLSNIEETQEIAASKAGMDVKTARKYLRARLLPSESKAERHWRTRQDGFAEEWPEIRAQLKANPGLEAKTLFAALQRQYPDRFADGQLRTLQRRIKQWRASEGPAQEVYFVQEHRARYATGLRQKKSASTASEPASVRCASTSHIKSAAMITASKAPMSLMKMSAARSISVRSERRIVFLFQ